MRGVSVGCSSRLAHDLWTWPGIPEFSIMTAPFACDISAILPADRARHQELTRYLVDEAAEAIEETTSALVLQFRPADLDAVTEFLARERHCCPFIDFTLLVPSAQRSIRLELSGPEGAAEFLRAELGVNIGARSTAP